MESSPQRIIVAPAKARVQRPLGRPCRTLDSRFRGNDESSGDVLRIINSSGQPLKAFRPGSPRGEGDGSSHFVEQEEYIVSSG
jgi:hypothetical protein